MRYILQYIFIVNKNVFFDVKIKLVYISYLSVEGFVKVNN